MINKIKRVLKYVLIFFERGAYKKYLLKKYLSKILPATNVIDIGASYFPHGRFDIFLNSEKTFWVAIDPNIDNLSYVDNWNYKSNVIKVAEALSFKGGVMDFFKTNIDSGSSNLRFDFNENIKHRISYKNLIPIEEKKINTIKLIDVISDLEDTNIPCVIKLDTQGTEFDILKSLGEEYIKKNIISIEIETTLSNSPLNLGSGKFHEIVNYFENLNFEIAKLDVINFLHPKLDSKIKYNNFPKECDLVLIKKSSVVGEMNFNQKLIVIACYFSYNLYSEAAYIMDHIISSKEFSKKPKKLKSALFKIFKILKLSKSNDIPQNLESTN